jgi:ferredoxin
LSTLKYFYDEYVTHVRDKRCPAGVCEKLLIYTIGEKCLGCGICSRACPVHCISGKKKKQHVIDQDRCIKCGICETGCPVQAVIRSK